jgi:uncharacterized protein YndB with AHSA1/START domain
VVTNEHTVEIERPPGAVFPYLTEPDRLLRWVGGLRSFVPEDGEEAQVGSRSRQRMRVAGREWDFKGEILELEPHKRLVVCVRGHGLQMTNTYVLEPTGKGTRLAVGARTELGRVFGRLLGGFVRHEGQRKLETDLGRLAKLVEAET